MIAEKPLRKQKYRSIFISDVHLGFRGCQAEFLLHFLQSTKSDYLYLIGDIFDGWEMRKKAYWPIWIAWLNLRNGTACSPK